MTEYYASYLRGVGIETMVRALHEFIGAVEANSPWSTRGY